VRGFVDSGCELDAGVRDDDAGLFFYSEQPIGDLEYDTAYAESSRSSSAAILGFPSGWSI
jgi:hypothetical protein